MNKIHYLYKIINTENNKIYIGQTINPKARWYEHKRLASKENPNMIITRAIKKYGNCVFEFEVIACCINQDDANYTEEELIKQYNSTDKDIGYNVKPGGNVSSTPEEIKEKIRQSLLGKKHTEERKQNNSIAHMGQEAWNKGTKGIMKPNKTSFKNGHKAPITAFQSGQKAWNAGLPKEQQPAYGNKYNLGKCKFTLDQINEMKKMHLDGLSNREIGRHFNCAHSTIARLIHG